MVADLWFSSEASGCEADCDSGATCGDVDGIRLDTSKVLVKPSFQRLRDFFFKEAQRDMLRSAATFCLCHVNEVEPRQSSEWMS